MPIKSPQEVIERAMCVAREAEERVRKEDEARKRLTIERRKASAEAGTERAADGKDEGVNAIKQDPTQPRSTASSTSTAAAAGGAMDSHERDRLQSQANEERLRAFLPASSRAEGKAKNNPTYFSADGRVRKTATGRYASATEFPMVFAMLGRHPRKRRGTPSSSSVVAAVASGKAKAQGNNQKTAGSPMMTKGDGGGTGGELPTSAGRMKMVMASGTKETTVSVGGKGKDGGVDNMRLRELIGGKGSGSGLPGGMNNAAVLARIATATVNREMEYWGSRLDRHLLFGIYLHGMQVRLMCVCVCVRERERERE